MINVTTKKYQLDSKTYIKIAFGKVLKAYWWAFLVPIALILPGFYFTSALVWLVITAVVVTILYLLFWYIQFYGVTQLPQGKPLFEKQAYLIDQKYLGVLKNPADKKQVMGMDWKTIKSAEKREDGFILHLSLVQFIFLPFTIFNSELEIKFTETLLKRKSLL